MLALHVLRGVLCLLVAVPLLSAQPRSDSARSAGDSLGLSVLNRELAIVPKGRLSTSLTLGELTSAAPEVRLETAGVTAAGYGIMNRADRIEILFGFGWDSGDFEDRKVTAAATLSEVDVRWQGTDSKLFLQTLQRFTGSLEHAPSVPSCLDTPADAQQPLIYRYQRSVAWFAGGWISTMTAYAAKTGDQTTFVVHYRAFPLSPSVTKYYQPTRTDPSCLVAFNDLAGVVGRIH